MPFRLLTEYHSFLYLMSCAEYLNEFDYFRLLAEYYSFLFLASGNKESAKVYEEFPSPCGVLFILISEYNPDMKCVVSPVSVSLWSIIHSYPIVKKVFYYHMFLVCYREKFLFLNFLFISNKSIFNSSFFRYYPITIFFLI